jgi:hypothetical protein
MRVWRIRGGRRGRLVVEEFWARDFVALAWQELGHSVEGMERKEIVEELSRKIPRRSAAAAAGQL